MIEAFEDFRGASEYAEEEWALAEPSLPWSIISSLHPDMEWKPR